MGLGERLRRAREAKGLTQEQLGKLLNVTDATINRYEKGTRQPAPAMLRRLAETLGVSVDYLLGHNGWSARNIPCVTQNGRTYGEGLPIYGTVPAGLPVGTCPIEEGRLPAPPGVDGRYWLVVEGDSMEPLIYHGDLVLIHEQDWAEHGKIVVAWVDGEHTVKEFRVARHGRAFLHPLNPAYEDIELDENSRIIGVVTAICRKLKK